MRVLFNGVEANDGISAFKGADTTIKLDFLNDDGGPVDLTGGTVDIEVYGTTARTGTPNATFDGVLVTPTGGYATVDLPALEMTFGPGTFYMYALFTDAGSDKHYGNEYSKLKVK